MALESLTDKQLIEDFVKDCKTKRMSPHTIVSYKSSLKLFVKYISEYGYRLIDVDKKICVDYIGFLNEQGMSYSTMKNRLSTYNSFYDYLKFNDLINDNIVKDVCKRYLGKYKDNYVAKRKIISVEEMSRYKQISVVLVQHVLYNKPVLEPSRPSRINDKNDDEKSRETRELDDDIDWNV